ncbi:hypothetical protein [Acinetobacter sp.]|uniref:hypothetical protein n=1 Tax=Acinetobacter sp. TaxID=472 RepID=UPI003D028B9E
MAKKEKGSNSQAVSMLTLMPVALGIIKYQPQLLQHLRDVSGDLSSFLGNKLNNIPGMQSVSEQLKANSTTSGSKAKNALISKASERNSFYSASEEHLRKAIKQEQLVNKYLDNQKALTEAPSWKEITKIQEKFVKGSWSDKSIGSRFEFIPEPNKDVNRALSKLPTVFADYLSNFGPRRKLMNDYISYLAYKEIYGAGAILSETLTPEMLEQYARMVENDIKTDGHRSVQLRQAYGRIHYEMRSNRELFDERLKNITGPGTIDKRKINKSNRFIAEVVGAPIPLEGLSIGELTHEIMAFNLDDGGTDHWDNVVNHTQARRGQSTLNAIDIATTVDELKKSINELKKQMGEKVNDPTHTPKSRLEAQRVLKNIENLDVRVYKQANQSGWFTHKSIVIEIFNNKVGTTPLRIPIGLQQGAYATRSAGVLPVVTPGHVPFGETSPSHSLNTTSMSVQMVRASIPKIINDIAGTTGDPSRSSGMISSIQDRVFSKSSPATGSARDVIGALSLDFGITDLATGNASYGDMKKIAIGVPSLERLHNIGRPGENLMVFDLEFVHPDMSKKQIGPQKAINSPQTKVWNIGMRVINTNTWEEVLNYDVMIDPEADWAHNEIRDFLKKKTKLTKKEIDTFIEKSLKGAPGKISKNEFRAKNLQEGISIMLDLAEANNVRTVGGHFIAGADMGLLEKQLEYMSKSGDISAGELAKRAEKLLHVNIQSDSSMNVIDSFYIEYLQSLGSFDQAKSQEFLIKKYLGVSHETAGDVLKVSFKMGNKFPERALNKIADAAGENREVVYKLYESIRKMKLGGTTLSVSHFGGFDTAMDSLIIMLQKENISRMPYDMYKYSQLGRVARDVLQNGNAGWNAAYRTMETFLPNVFTNPEQSKDPNAMASLSLMASSQQQGAKLLGSMLHIQNTMPFGFLNNMMRQKYQAFSGWAMLPATEAAIKDAASKGIEYMPGHMLSTVTGEAMFEHTRHSPIIGGQVSANADPRMQFTSGVHVQSVLPVFKTPEALASVIGDQGLFNTDYSRLLSYVRGIPKVKNLQLEIPIKWRGMSPAQVYNKIKNDIHPAIRRAIERRIEVTSHLGLPDTWDNHAKVDAAMTAEQASALNDALRTKGASEFVDNVGPLRDYYMFADEKEFIWRSSGTEASKPVRYSETFDSQVISAALTNDGTLTYSTASIDNARAGVKMTGGSNKSFKVFIYGGFNSTDKTINVGGNPAALLPFTYGKSRQEFGSFLSDHIGRVLQKIHDDPRLSKDPYEMEKVARKALGQLLGFGDDLKIMAVRTNAVSERYRLKVTMPSYDVQKLRGMMNINRTLAMLKDAGITYSYVKEQFDKAVAKVDDATTREKLQSSYDDVFRQTIKKFEAHVHQLETKISEARTPNEMEAVKLDLTYYRSMLKNMKDYHVNGNGDLPALFDVQTFKYGDRYAAIAGFFTASDVSIVNDIQDLIHHDPEKVPETGTKLPLGHTRFRPYFTTLMEENLLRRGAGPEDLTNLLSKNLGISYVNSKGEMPVANTIASIRQAIEILKNNPETSDGIDSIKSLFSKVEMLQNFEMKAPQELLTAVHGRNKYRILNEDDLKLLVRQLDPGRLHAEALQRTGGEGLLFKSSEDLVEAIAKQKGISKEHVLGSLSDSSQILFDDVIDNVSVLNRQTKTKINLLKIDSVESLLKSMGVTEQQIQNSPELKKLTTDLKLKISFTDELAKELIDNLPVSGTQKDYWRWQVKNAGVGDVNLSMIPVLQQTDALSPYVSEYRGKDVIVVGKELTNIRDVSDSILNFHESVRVAASSFLKGAAIETDIAAAQDAAQDLTNAVKGLINVTASNLKMATEKGAQMFTKAGYKLHASGFNKIAAVMLGVLSNGVEIPEEVSKDVLRNIVNLHGTHNKASGILNKMTSDELRLVVNDIYTNMNRKGTFDFSGFRLNEALIDQGELNAIVDDYLKKLDAAKETQTISPDEYKARKRAYYEMKQGKRGLPTTAVKMPEFPHEQTRIAEAYGIHPWIMEMAGIRKSEASGFMFLNSMLSNFIGRADYDGDLLAVLRHGDHIALDRLDTFNKMDANNIYDQTVINNPLSNDPYPFSRELAKNDKGLPVFKLLKDGSVSIDPTTSFPAPSGAHTEKVFGDTVRQSLLIKSFTSVLGGMAQRIGDRAHGQSQAYQLIPEILMNDNALAGMVYKESGLSAKDILKARTFLNETASGMADRNTNMLDTTVHWANQLTERYSILKSKSNVGEKEALQMADFVQRLERGELTRDDIIYAVHDQSLRANEAHLSSTDFINYNKVNDADQVAAESLRHFNTLNRAVSVVNNIIHKSPYGDYREVTSKDGSHQMLLYLKEMIGYNPATASSFARQRSGIEKVLGIGSHIDPSNIGLGDLNVGNSAGDAIFFDSSLRGILKNTFKMEAIGNAVRDTVSELVGKNWHGSFKTGGLAIAALAFFSPNMGVEPQGDGGEKHDWPSLNLSHAADAMSAVVRVPHASTMEKLLDIDPPDRERRPVNLHLPKRPPRPAYISDLRSRNWTLNEYINKSEAVLLT